MAERLSQGEMVKRASWRKIKELKLGKFKITLYRDRDSGLVYRAEISEEGAYCGDVYFYFDDEIVLICHVGGVNADNLRKVLSRLEDMLQRWKTLS